MKDPNPVSPQLTSDLDLNYSFSTIEIVRYLSFNVESTFENNPPPSSTAAALSSPGNHTRHHVHGAPTSLPPLPPPPPPPPLPSKKSTPWTPETTQKNPSAAAAADRGSPSVYHYLLLEGGGEGGGKRRRRSAGRRSMSETDDHAVCQIVPRTASGKISSVFLVFIPTAAMIAVAVTWFYLSRQSIERSKLDQQRLRQRTLQIGKLIVDFNAEREMTAMYVSSRSVESQSAIKVTLDEARRNANRSLAALTVWPSSGGTGEARLFRSPHLFAAILNNHRDLVRPGASYFWDEVQFYTDVLDTFLGWLSREIGTCSRHGRAFGLLHSYSYLMGAVSYLGAEQALCAVFHSVICFSHRETFYYANFSFSGEAVFRLYRQSYTGTRRPDGWRTAGHRTFFPELSNCRQEVLSDMDYIGMSSDPSLCNHARKNETRFHDVDLIYGQEAPLLVEELDDSYAPAADELRLSALLSTVALAGTGSYVVIAHLLRCVLIRQSSGRMKRDRKRTPPNHLQEQQQQHQQYHYLPPQHQTNHHQHIQVTAVPVGKCDVETNAHLTSAAVNLANDRSENHKQSRSFAALKVASV